MPTARRIAVTTACFLALTTPAAVLATVDRDGADDKPRRESQRNPLPRNMTPAERDYVRQNPLTTLRGASEAPTGPLTTPAEYSPAQGVMFSYVGAGSWKDILDQMAAEITTTGDADVYVYVPNQSGVQEVQNYMIDIAGADPDRVTTIVQPTDSIWIRDYGPRYVYEGDVRIIVDHTYNRPRPLDNQVPEHFSNVINHEYYEIPLVHGGGNYHLDNTGIGNSTKLIANENPNLTEQEIQDLWQAYQNLATTLFDPFPTSVDATQHIDMWMIPIADDAIIISDWPAQSGSTQDVICDAAANHFAAEGYTVHRIPARRLTGFGGAHYTYTNSVIVNDLVLIPRYTNSTIQQYNDQAKAVWEAALPDHTIVQINCQGIVTAAGVMHCIMMHVPAPLGGENPTAYLRSLRGGESLDPGDTVYIAWSSDDDEGVSDVDLLLSTDSGATFDHTIVEGTEDDGRYIWTVPDIDTDQARLRVVVNDANGNSGFDMSDADFSIDGTTPAVPGDLNDDGAVNVSDMLMLLGDWGACPGCDADLNGDDLVNVSDLLMLLGNWG